MGTLTISTAMFNGKVLYSHYERVSVWWWNLVPSSLRSLWRYTWELVYGTGEHGNWLMIWWWGTLLCKYRFRDGGDWNMTFMTFHILRIIIPIDELIEGSLEAKLPTIWRDENGTARKTLGRVESQQGEDQRWRKSEERRCRCAKR